MPKIDSRRLVESRWKLPVLGGIFLGTSYYVPWLIFNLIAFLPLLLWIDGNLHANRYTRLRAGLLFGFVAHLITLHFVAALLVWTWLPVLLYFAFAGALAVRISISIWLASSLRRRTGWSWGLLLPVCWIPLEWLLTFGDLRMTGDHLAHTVAGYPFLIQFADLGGHYAVGFVLLSVNGLLYEALLAPVGKRRRSAMALAILVAAVLAYDAWRWFSPEEGAETLRVALVQPNVPLSVKRSEESENEQLKALFRLSHDARGLEPQLIVWPETARPSPIYHWLDRPDTYAMNDVQLLAESMAVPFVVGVELVRIHTVDDFTYYNAVVAVDADGEIDPTWAGKVYLVPFVESLPFRALFGGLVEGRSGAWEWISGGFSRGPRNVVMEVAGTRLGTLVCFEQLFPDLARGLRNHGARVQLVVTNDAWFGRTAFQRYQADVVRLRAIENRSPFVRAANTGISGFVDARGRYHEATPLFEEAVAAFDLRLASGRTPYGTVGDVAASGSTLALVLLLVWARRRG